MKPPIGKENPFVFEKDHKKVENISNSFYSLFKTLKQSVTNQLQQNKLIVNDQEEEEKQAYYEKLYLQSKNISKYGIIRMMRDEANKLAKERDEMFARDHLKDEVMQDLKHFSAKLMQETKDSEHQKKAYRIRNILKEKRETIAEYVNKKREIFLSNMNISIKEEETLRLEDFIKNEQESLRARQLYFKNDCELVKQFMNEVKKQADEASKLADNEAKKKESQKDQMSQITQKIEQLKLIKTKKKEEFDRLEEYKQFHDKLKENYKSIFDEIDFKRASFRQSATPVSQVSRSDANSLVFVTQQPDDKVRRSTLESKEGPDQQEENKNTKMAELMIEILNHIQEKNLQNIQNQHDSEEELEMKKRELAMLKEEFARKLKDNLESLKALERKKEQALHQQQTLHQVHKINSSKLQFSDGEDLDLDRIGREIMDIYRDIQGTQSKKNDKELDTKEIHRSMTDIEKTAINLLELKKEILKSATHRQAFLEPLEKKIKDREKKTRQMKTQDDDKVRLLQEKLQKKEDYLKNFYRGRKPVYKSYVDKKIKENKQKKVEKVDNDERYFDPAYELLN